MTQYSNRMQVSGSAMYSLIARRTVLLVLTSAVPLMALPVEQGTQFVGRSRSSSFRFLLPEGWRVAWSPDSTTIPTLAQPQAILFEFARPAAGSSPPALLWIEGINYTDTVPIAVRRRREESGTESTAELQRLDNTSIWSISESANAATLTAYAQLGSDVLCVHLKVPAGSPFAQAKSNLIAILNSFTELPKLP